MKRYRGLTRSEEQEIEVFARNKLSDYGKLNDIIGSQIFSILGQYARVLYYPLEDDDIWGFVENTTKGAFVCINTSINYEKQVFVAAHELYHILHHSHEELTLAKNLEENSSGEEPVLEEELKANRFAAAFLIETGLLLYQLNVMKITKDSLNEQDVLRIANLFTVPYKTMVRRLYEIGFINLDQQAVYLSVSGTDINIMKKRLGLLTPKQEENIVLANLVETAVSLYERHLITVEKLEQILSYSKLTLADVGIDVSATIPLTDAEIDALLEE